MSWNKRNNEYTSFLRYNTMKFGSCVLTFLRAHCPHHQGRWL